MSKPRRKPYTTIGISRVPCARCGKPSVYQWRICSDGGRFRAICADCDIGLNKLVLQYMWPKAWKRKHAAYVKMVMDNA